MPKVWDASLAQMVEAPDQGINASGSEGYGQIYGRSAIQGPPEISNKPASQEELAVMEAMANAARQQAFKKMPRVEPSYDESAVSDSLPMKDSKPSTY